MQKPHYSYIHLFLHPAKMFNQGAQQMVEELPHAQNHLFVYAWEESMPARRTEQTILDNSIMGLDGLRKYLGMADYVVVHHLTYSYEELAALTEEEAGKIIWFVWGNDLYRMPARQDRLYLLVRKVYRVLKGKEKYKEQARRTVSRFHAINAGFVGDRDYIRRMFGDQVQLYDASYPMGYFAEDLDRWADTTPHRELGVLIGHCAAKYLKHKKYLQKLLPYKGKIHLYVPLSYGGDAYAKKICGLPAALYGEENVTVPLTRMSPEEYVKMLSRVDVAIFDYKQQAGLGNLYLLMYLGKKIFLNPQGTLYKGFREIGCEVYDVRRMDQLSLEELACSAPSAKNREVARKVFDHNELRRTWAQVFGE